MEDRKIREGVSGRKKIDMTTGPIMRNVLIFAILSAVLFIAGKPILSRSRKAGKG